MPHPKEGSPRSRASAGALRRHFWQPPRAHGDVIEGRDVSFLELFYDLVYVVIISQAAHHRSGDVTWAGAGRFAVVFGMIWFAWVNGAILPRPARPGRCADAILRFRPDGRPGPARGVHR